MNNIFTIIFFILVILVGIVVVNIVNGRKLTSEAV
jgi:hypothetical protein